MRHSLTHYKPYFAKKRIFCTMFAPYVPHACPMFALFLRCACPIAAVSCECFVPEELINRFICDCVSWRRHKLPMDLLRRMWKYVIISKNWTNSIVNSFLFFSPFIYFSCSNEEKESCIQQIDAWLFFVAYICYLCYNNYATSGV